MGSHFVHWGPTQDACLLTRSAREVEEVKTLVDERRYVVSAAPLPSTLPVLAQCMSRSTAYVSTVYEQEYSVC
jgi:saccharopine dehydrogenase-like NADP-dependent oxidoreductase